MSLEITIVWFTFINSFEIRTSGMYFNCVVHMQDVENKYLKSVYVSARTAAETLNNQSQNDNQMHPNVG
jgi:hypothetical protein